MAVSAKTPPNSLPHDLIYPHNSKPHLPKTLKLSQNPTHLQILFKRSREISALHSNSLDNFTNWNSEICQLCCQGKLEEALKHLDSIDESTRIPIEEETYISLLKLCESKRATHEGAEVYDRISKSVTLLSVRLGNALLSMFIRFGNLLDAWFVFGKMEERDVFSWNVILGGYAKTGFFDEALNLYHQMLWVGVKPDVYTFPCVLRICGGIPDLGRGKEIHVHVIRFGFESNVDVINALITMYVKCRDVYSARLIFDKMPKRDRISWNAMISGYFENEEFLEGLGLFLLMRNLPIDPDLMTLTSVIAASGSLGDDKLGRQFHGYITKVGFGVDVSVNNSLVQMYASVGELGEADKLFHRMEVKDVVSWTAMICGYEKNGLPNKAVETYEQMEAEGVTPDEIALASVLSACSCLGSLGTGIKLHEYANKTRLIEYTIVRNALIEMYSKCRLIDKALEVFKQIPEKNVISWTSIIFGLRTNNRSLEALTFFRQMKRSLKPNLVTLVAAVSACARLGALMCGKEIHAHILRIGFDFEKFLSNSLLDMYVRCGRMDYALILFEHEEKDVSSWNILLTGYARRGDGKLASDLFNRMIDEGVNPDEITFLALLCSCSKSGMVNEGLGYFNSMKSQYFVTPNLKHYACVVDLLGRASFLDKALEFIEEMPIKPDAAVWGALLNACRIHKQVELGEVAARSLFQLDTQSLGYYVLLCNLYAESGKWNEVARVRKMMQENGLTIDPGCCWVEVKGSFHAFLSGDESHPQMKEIKAVLEGLDERMKTAGLETPSSRLSDKVEASKADVLCGHSERFAIGFALINSVPGMPIRVTKNLYMCESCHISVKFISTVVRREITVRDTKKFHHFKDGICSCGD